MKKFTALFLALCVLLALAACGAAPATASEAPVTATAAAAPTPTVTPAPSPTAEPVELVVFAAASLTETLTECIELYKGVAPEVSITPTFDSSGTLRTQIQEGAGLRCLPLRRAEADEPD